MPGIDGLISGIPTADLVDSLIEASRGATRVTENRKTVFEARLEAVRNLNTRLLSARIDSASLKQPSTFQARSASSSSASTLTADAKSNAVPGVYQLEVLNIAQTHQVATAGQGSSSSDLGTGSVTLQLGNGSETTLDLANASLDDIVTQINESDLGITASVINDGQANPFRLVLQSTESGLDNAITVSGTGDFANLFDQAGLQMTELSAALDANLKFGAGAGAITITSSTNALTDVIPGVTLNLLEAGTSTITVGTDTEAAETAISTFVESINSAIGYFRSNATFDSVTGEAGVLFGEGGLRRSVESLTRSLSDPVSGLTGGKKLMSSIGIDINQTTGLFDIDSAVLSAALASDPDGVRDLFVNRGTSSNNGIQFAAMSAKTNTDNTFDIEITQASTRAQAASTGDLAVSTLIEAGNKSLSFIVNDNTYFVSLTEGSYSRTEMADHLEKVMNEAIGSRGSAVEVVLDGNALDLRTVNYGSRQSITMLSSTTLTSLNLATSTSTGLDVAGTIDGATATGIGQVLQGVADSTSEGLRLLITASSPVAGVTLDVFEGLGQRISSSLQSMTDVETGVVTQKENSIESIILDLDESINDVNARMDEKRTRLFAKFQAMESLLQQFQSQENFLQGQISGFQNMAAARANG